MPKYPRTSRKQVAHTFYDKRYKIANKINNLHKKCDGGHDITATQVGNEVTIKCACTHSSTTQCTGLFNEYDAIADFTDSHP
jgi:hypothetical protein